MIAKRFLGAVTAGALTLTWAATASANFNYTEADVMTLQDEIVASTEELKENWDTLSDDAKLEAVTEIFSNSTRVFTTRARIRSFYALNSRAMSTKHPTRDDQAKETSVVYYAADGRMYAWIERANRRVEGKWVAKMGDTHPELCFEIEKGAKSWRSGPEYCRDALKFLQSSSLFAIRTGDVFRLSDGLPYRLGRGHMPVLPDYAARYLAQKGKS
jgi:hypothetical protein